MGDIEVHPIGRVVSSLVARTDAPRQAVPGAPAATLVLDARVEPALRDVRPGDRIVVVTWLHEAARDVLRVRPGHRATAPERGVFSTRSPDRPNPIGLHETTVVAVEGTEVRVDHLEAIDGTPVLDVKPARRERRG